MQTQPTLYKCVIITWHIYSVIARWHTYASGHWVIIGLGNGLAPIRRQAITRTNTDKLQIRSQITHSTKFYLKI